jgi:hypothetical protein
MHTLPLETHLSRAMKDVELDEFNYILREVVNTICPNNYKHGAYKYVFFPYFDPNIVVKVAFTQFSNQNVLE